jgi:hypothetical protein
VIQLVVWLVILASSIAVGVDSSRLGARRGVLGGGMLDMGPAGWFLSCLFLWIIGLPCYLAARGRLIRRRDALAALQRNGFRSPAEAAYAAGPLNAPPPASPPGWYADPAGRPQWRWWSGDRWTDAVR